MLGLIAGAAGMFLYTGVIQDRPTDVGSGIQNLINAARNASNSERTVKPAESTQQAAGPSEGFKFNFYELLLEDEVILPSQRPIEKVAKAADPGVSLQQPEKSSRQQPEQAPPEPQAAAQPPATYVLQAGSFNKFQDADKLKAQLALNGVVSFIQKVTIEDRGDFYRVRLGPFENLDKMRTTQSKLVDQGFKLIAFKLKKES